MRHPTGQTHQQLGKEMTMEAQIVRLPIPSQAKHNPLDDLVERPAGRRRTPHVPGLENVVDRAAERAALIRRLEAEQESDLEAIREAARGALPAGESTCRVMGTARSARVTFKTQWRAIPTENEKVLRKVLGKRYSQIVETKHKLKLKASPSEAIEALKEAGLLHLYEVGEYLGPVSGYRSVTDKAEEIAGIEQRFGHKPTVVF